MTSTSMPIRSPISHSFQPSKLAAEIYYDRKASLFCHRSLT